LLAYTCRKEERRKGEEEKKKKKKKKKKCSLFYFKMRTTTTALRRQCLNPILHPWPRGPTRGLPGYTPPSAFAYPLRSEDHRSENLGKPPIVGGNLKKHGMG
jgi:hypothetical protein